MAKTRAAVSSRHTNQKRDKKNKKKRTNSSPHSGGATPVPSSAVAAKATSVAPRARAPTLAAAPAAPAPAWLGPNAPWHTDRACRRVDQARHATPPPDEAAWAARLHEYLDRDDGAAHIPPRVYNTVLDTVRTPSRTTFARYGWVRTFAEYDAYAADNPGKYAYELWFGHRGMARASLDARKALIRGAAAYSDRQAPGAYEAEVHAVAMTDDDAVADGTNGTAPLSPTMADYADGGYDDEMPFPMDPEEASGEGEVVGEGATGDVAALVPPCPPQLLLDCADDDTF